ncbi:uncharacterized protein RHIMIDRAFT_273888 [Rhizopus microsporus ATCC 52813]|uniref:Uncharacterized protein n=1 Tax=Rhizopus microsporus ATCC 52813 TaxID=1340429 RepID=A0A2G4SGC3_RHIZD|nr:uncharacterized protein RHIMIDRAFT_273888 [Rhizopus microsporus ATCC 52813]PHZ07821.1 hypothetical protein RHIMIDRAFT_273888 [Rhizopus microsporus ATCC 52813]
MKASFEERALCFVTDALSIGFLRIARRPPTLCFVRKGSDKLHSETFAKNLDIYNQSILYTE